MLRTAEDVCPPASMLVTIAGWENVHLTDMGTKHFLLTGRPSGFLGLDCTADVVRGLDALAKTLCCGRYYLQGGC
jgi:hypothetical protein